MNRFLWPLAGFALLVVVLIVGLRNAEDKGIIESPLLGKPAPAFTVPDLIDGNAKVDSSSLRGQWYLLNVWGTWCAGCRDEHAALLAIKDEGRVPIVGLDWKDDDAAALAWLAQLGNPYSVVGADRDGRVAIDWGVYGAPESFLVDPAGIVVQKRVGIMTMEIWQRDFLPHLTATGKVSK
jgi:cytochrome c biogenesis protein CcmG/thiol:disulfide interchange protein DsbE